MTKIEIMENVASFIGYSKYNFGHDWVEVLDEGDHFVYYFNGIEYGREYIEERIPYNFDGFEDESVLH